MVTSPAAASDCLVQRWILPGGTHAIEGCVVPVRPDLPASAHSFHEATKDELPPRLAPRATETVRQPAKRAADTEDPVAVAIAATAESTGWIALGDPAAPALWMVVDPECPACAAAMARLAAPLTEGRLSLRAILTPFLGPSSLHRSAGILLAEHPDIALLEHEMAKSVGIADEPADDGYRLSNLGHRMLHENLVWMDTAGITAVPHFLWRGSDGTWHQRRGEIPGIGELEAAMPSAAPSSRLYLPPSWPARSESLPAVVTPAREITAADMREEEEGVPDGG